MKRIRVFGCLFVVILAVGMLSGCTRNRNNTQNTQMSTQAQTGASAGNGMTEMESDTSAERDTSAVPGMESGSESGASEESTMLPSDSGMSENTGEESTGVIGGLADDLKRAVTHSADEVTGR